MVPGGEVTSSILAGVVFLEVWLCRWLLFVLYGGVGSGWSEFWAAGRLGSENRGPKLMDYSIIVCAGIVNVSVYPAIVFFEWEEKDASVV